MNGIIHNCTHKDSNIAVTQHVTEDEMFIKIFNYIEHLFGKIKPQKLFFMAIDGVAPRAKMNQQRSRRFRTALDVENTRAKAIREGKELPKEDPFDSNCITPGTEFMARLSEQLKYFVNKKVSEDADWQGCEIVLSGHEVPGEGEHKIMEYIRQAKSQPDYDPNVRHCLYGLDADLIMLGLLSHDPHFCLLREEVTFGRQSKNKSQELEHQNFYLMHLCIVREYLELEFQELKEPRALGKDVAFDMEHIIDDFILMAFFVGNDFLPNLPYLHINEGALALMFGVYKQVLPKAGGYINEGGVINMERLKLLLDELRDVEYRFFQHENHDAGWLKDKSVQKEDVMEKVKRKKWKPVVMTTEQKGLYLKVKRYVNTYSASLSDEYPALDMPGTLKASDRAFVEDLSRSLHLGCSNIVDDDGNRHLQLSLPKRLEMDEEDEEDEEAQNALLRVFKQYDSAKIEDVSAEEAQTKAQQKYDEKFQGWKNKYYRDKFGWGLENEEEMTKLARNYVQGLQWVLFYYYRGVASWPWFYAYHYSPMMSDVQQGLDADVDFQLGQPFRPFQQLMGVLPDRSKKIVPRVYWDLMTSPESPIVDFYPRDFELDMNGKKMEWEAVVKIPFIDEKRLLPAMETKEAMLSDEERKRNEFGVTLKFAFDDRVDYTYRSSLPGVFPDLEHCKCVENIFELPTMDGLDVYVGLAGGVKLGEAALAGFPSLHTLPHVGHLGFQGICVFQQESRNESMVIKLKESEEKGDVADAKQKLGKAVHVGYPFLTEGMVVSVSDEMFVYSLADASRPAVGANVVQRPHAPKGITEWRNKAQHIEGNYSRRLGMVIGTVESLVQVEMLVGLRKTELGATIKQYAPISGMEPDYATQTVVDRVLSEDARFLEKEAVPIAEDFPLGTRAFFLGEMAYGRPLEVTGYADDKADAWVSVLAGREPEFGHEIARHAEQMDPYMPSFQLARMLRLHPLVLSKLTSAFSVTSSGLRLNLGLNLKFESKKQKVLGYSRKGQTGWEYSQRAVDLLVAYMTRFPEFVAQIGANPTGDGWEDTTFYPDPQEAREKMKEIGAWLRTVETEDLERVPLEAEQLGGDVVQAIERAADQLMATGPEMQGRRIAGSPRSALLKPSEAELRTGGQRFRLGDRVVYLLDSGRVPIALRGTTVGITRTARQILLDVVFDVTFLSGTTLGGRCSAFRGSTVPASAVLNLSDKQLVAASSASRARQPLPRVAAPLHTARMAGPSAMVPGPYGMPGVAQLQSMPAPARLQSGYSTAAARSLPMHPRGRGGFGGAVNRQGFTIVDWTNPTAGVQTQRQGFQPATYRNVPPPPILDASGRGGGRGRGGRGRGGGGFNGGDWGRGRGRGFGAME